MFQTSAQLGSFQSSVQERKGPMAEATQWVVGSEGSPPFHQGLAEHAFGAQEAVSERPGSATEPSDT